MNNLSFSNTEEKFITLNDEKSYAVSDRAADRNLKDESNKDNMFVFKGAENPIILSRVYDVEWICEYDMRYS